MKRESKRAKVMIDRWREQRQRVGRLPATVELRAVVMAAVDLERRAGRWLDEHPSGCRCETCRMVMRHGDGLYPDVRTVLSAVRVVLRSLGDQLRSETPNTAAELAAKAAAAAEIDAARARLRAADEGE